MDFGEYQFEARRTQNKTLPLWAMREHALLGLAAEVGEVCGLHQKVHQGHALDVGDVLLELGDVLWFVAETCDCYGLTMEEVAKANIAKLQARYPKEFDADRSINRPEYVAKRKLKSRYYIHKGGGKGAHD